MRSWSFSALTSYEQCPHRLRLKEQKAPVLPQEENRGTQIHALAEKYIRGEIEAMPRELMKFEDTFDYLRGEYAAGRVTVEREWGFTPDWEPTDWFSAWLRVKTDVCERVSPAEITVYDWKTGKREGNEVKASFQGQLYALAAFMRFPEVEAIGTEFCFLDKGERISRVYSRDKDLTRIFNAYKRRVDVMMGDLLLTPKPSRMACRFCVYGPNEGGSNACAHGIASEAR